ncbi:O-antigen/teichoic acid export membrane protein [Methanohalophilus levihalophilus]|uniref:flippase n=1 Tax=Methanohalophilus levihalophilus TaxID=1431282 RepID=UPI001AE93B2B|nr:flippase [Methanohalophilus levihalophilus]MBP2029950.1 O-antigen/teichoic acid export membrane protein [Methanohalophilus levihalophilus]
MNDLHLSNSLKTIIRGSGIGFIGVFFGTFIGYISRMLIAQFLGPDGYGLISLGYSVMMISATISLMGLSTGVQRYIAYYSGKGDERRLKGTIVSSLKIIVPMSIFSMGVVLVGSDWISSNIFHEDNLKPVLIVFSIGIPFWTLSTFFNSIYIGFHQIKYQVYTMYLFKDSAKLLMILILLLLGYDVLGAAIGWIIAVIGMTILSFYFLTKKVLSPSIEKVKAISVDKELYYFSFPLIFAGLASLITGWTDTFMLGYFATSSEVGIYNAALPTSQLLRMVLSPIGQILFPVLATLYAERKLRHLGNIYSIVTKWIFSIVFPGFLLMVLFSNDILAILFGEAYVSGANALAILAFGVFISATVGPAQQIITVYGKTKTIMWGSSFTAIINIILNFLLIPLYGVSGAAIATSISITLVSIFHLIFAYRIGGTHPFRNSFIKPFVSALFAIIIVFEVSQRLNQSSFVALIFGTILFGIVYLLLIYLTKGFEEEDLMLLSDLNEKLNIKASWITKAINKFPSSRKP